MILLQTPGPAAIELGDMTINSATPLGEMLWFGFGLLLLAGLTALILWWQKKSRPDPFI